MAKSVWTIDHIDFLEALVRGVEELSSQQLATQMSRQFHFRITPAHVNVLLQRMRDPTDSFFRNIPYRRRGARRYV